MPCPLCLSVSLYLWVITVWTHKLHPPKIHSDTQLPSSLTRSQGYTYHDFTTNPSGEGLKFIVQNPKHCPESHLPYLPFIPGFSKICPYSVLLPFHRKALEATHSPPTALSQAPLICLLSSSLWFLPCDSHFLLQVALLQVMGTPGVSEQEDPEKLRQLKIK